MDSSTVRQIHPMLALRKDVISLGYYDSDDWCSQFKYDGERFINQITEARCIFTGRRPSKTQGGTLSNRTEQVPHLNLPDEFRRALKGTTIDGEFDHPLGFEDGVSKITKCKPAKAIALQEQLGKMQYRVYDILEYKGKDLRGLGFKQRYNYLTRFFEELTRYCRAHTMPVPYTFCATAFSTKEKKLMRTTAINLGIEGVILRNVNGTYEEGKKSHFLIKDKFHFEIDAVIMGFTNPSMKYTGKDEYNWKLWYNPKLEKRLAIVSAEPAKVVDEYKKEGYVPVSRTWFYGLHDTVIFGCYKDSVLTERGRCSGFNDETAYDMKEHPEAYIGEACEIDCYGILKSGKLRHPQWSRLRSDKDPKECVWEVDL